MDTIIKQRIENLHPSARDEVRLIIKECDDVSTRRAKIRITQGLRTFKEQEDLYSLGRTKAGIKVTNAKAGQSLKDSKIKRNKE